MNNFSLNNNPQSFDTIQNNDDLVIFITGGTGLVGSNLIIQLLSEGRKIKAIYRSKVPDFPGSEKVEWIQGDVLDVITLEEAMQGVSEVYHCAAIVTFNPARKQEMYKTNIEGTANVINAAIQAGVKKLCHVSSVAAIGKNPLKAEVDETITWSEEYDKSKYGKSKYLSELEVWRGIGEGLNAVIVNPSIILGAGNWTDGSTKIFKTAYEEFPWYTQGTAGFVDINDVVKAMIQLMAANAFNQRFIINGENRKFKEVFTEIAKAFNKRPPHRKVNRLLADIVRRFESIKSLLTGEEPLLTKETTEAAQSTVKYNNSKLLKYLPSFKYMPINEVISRVCKELAAKHSL